MESALIPWILCVERQAHLLWLQMLSASVHRAEDSLACLAEPG